MPCKKCENGKYKWGNTGECKYATKDECEKANPKKYSDMKNIPTPLGKKTYEEYAKELKEYNLSATQKIELNASDDLAESVKNLKSFTKTIKSENKEMQSSLKELKNINKRLSKSWSNLDSTIIKAKAEEKESLKIVNKLRKSAKELGISVNDIPAYKRWEDVDLSAIEKSEKDAKDTLKIINKIGI